MMKTKSKGWVDPIVEEVRKWRRELELEMEKNPKKVSDRFKKRAKEMGIKVIYGTKEQSESIRKAIEQYYLNKKSK